MNVLTYLYNTLIIPGMGYDLCLTLDRLHGTRGMCPDNLHPQTQGYNGTCVLLLLSLVDLEFMMSSLIETRSVSPVTTSLHSYADRLRLRLRCHRPLITNYSFGYSNAYTITILLSRSKIGCRDF